MRPQASAPELADRMVTAILENTLPAHNIIIKSMSMIANSSEIEITNWL